MNNKGVIRENFSLEYYDCVEGYIHTIEYVFSEYDIVIFMARKAICFFYALVEKNVLNIPGYSEKVFSSRCLSYNSIGLFKNKRVAIVDDVIVEGKTLLFACDWFEKNGMKDNVGVFAAACHEGFLSSKAGKYADLFPLSMAEYEERKVNEIAHQIIRFIGKTATPYNVDYPMYRVSFDEKCDPVAFFTATLCNEIGESYQKKAGQFNYVLNVCIDWLRSLSPCFQTVRFAKVRFYWNMKNKQAIALPIVLFDELSNEQLKALTEYLFDSDNSGDIQSCAEMSNCFRLVQYATARIVFCAFTTLYGFKYESIENEMALFGKKVTVSETVAHLSFDFLSTEAFCGGTKEYSYIDFYDYVNAAYDTVLERNLIDNGYCDAEERNAAGCLVVEDFAKNSLKMMNSYGQEFNEYAVSNVIDLFVDKGILVPCNLFRNNRIVRGYRCGEVTKITERTLRLFAGMLRRYQIESGGALLGRIEFEKACVLFFRSCAKSGIATEQFEEDDEDLYDVCFTRFGARIARTTNPKYAVAHDTFSSRMLNKTGIYEVASKETVFGEPELVNKYNATGVKNNWSDEFDEPELDFAKTFAVTLASIKNHYPIGFDELNKYRVKYKENGEVKYGKYFAGYNGLRYLNSYSNFLTCYSTGRSNKDRVFSLVAELALFVRTLSSLFQKLEDGNTITVREMINCILDEKKAIDSGLWKYCCYDFANHDINFKSGKKKLDIIVATVNALSNEWYEGTERVWFSSCVLNPYYATAGDKKDEMGGFLNECGLLLFRIACSVQNIAVKFVPDIIPKPQKGYEGTLFDYRWYRDCQTLFAKENESITSKEFINEEEAISFVRSLYYEAKAVISICDIYLEWKLFEDKRYQSVIVVKPNQEDYWAQHPRRLNVRLPKEGGEKQSANHNQYDVNVYLEAERKLDDLRDVLESVVGSTTNQRYRIVLAELGEWFEGLFGSAAEVRGVLFKSLFDEAMKVQEPFSSVSLTILCKNENLEGIEALSDCLKIRLYSKTKIKCQQGYWAHVYSVEKKNQINTSITLNTMDEVNSINILNNCGKVNIDN